MEPPPAPRLDTGRTARLRDVLAGGYLAYQADRDRGAALAPWHLGRLVRDANAFHRQAAVWAVTGCGSPGFRVPPAAGVIFAAAGYPAPDPDRPGVLGFHTAAQEASPGALFAYVEPHLEALTYNLALLAVPDMDHVAAYAATACAPGDVLGNGNAREILARGAVHVQLQLRLHWWDTGFCAWALTEYGRLLTPGSTLAVTLAVPGIPGRWEEFAAAARDAGCPVQAHTPADVAAWIEKAGLRVSPCGVTDVRAGTRSWADVELGRHRALRIVKAVAVKPPSDEAH